MTNSENSNYTMDNPHRHFFWIAFIAIIGASCSRTAQNMELPSLFSAWDQQEVLELEIETDLPALLAKGDADQPATISWQDATGSMQQLTAKVEVRGKTRREICEFPPLKLKFDEAVLQANGWNPAFENLKLVTHCINGEDELVLREYLTYLMLNQLTDKSFRVQLAKVTYRSGANATEAYAFVMENNDEMAYRLNGEVLEPGQLQLKAIDAEQYRLLTVFQYMIGNTDWNLAKSHNIKLVNTGNAKAPMPVPYDFDHSGLVNAPYAQPHPTMPIKTVRERFFQWRGQNAEGLDKTLQLFRDKKKTLYSLVNGFEYLSPASRQDILRYLDSFYRSLPQIPALASNNHKVNKKIDV